MATFLTPPHAKLRARDCACVVEPAISVSGGVASNDFRVVEPRLQRPLRGREHLQTLRLLHERNKRLPRSVVYRRLLH